MRNPTNPITLSPILLAGLAILISLLLGAPPSLAAGGEACPNESVRAESNVDPGTGQPYSIGLTQCRAYEMVSPLEKQQHDALTIEAPPRIAVAPEGGAIGWASQGAYADAKNYQVHSSHPDNPYVAQRTAAGWVTRSGYPPIDLVEDPGGAFGSSGVYSSNLGDESVCGGVTSPGLAVGPAIRCALRNPAGLWTGTPEYTDLTGDLFSEDETVGASSTAEDVVFYGEEGVPFLPSDTSSRCNAQSGHCGGIYEETGIGTGSPELRLVNVNNEGNMIGPENPSVLGAPPVEPAGSDYQAVSADGSKIFFTATPSGGVATVYARVDGAETVAISNPSPSECTTCSATPKAAVYEGASADGSKVFFTTEQQLSNSGTDEENVLYEYDFENPPTHRLVKASGGGLGDVTPGTGAGIGGVVSISEDGSHVYFITSNVLTTIPNGLGQSASVSPGSRNLYAYDTDTGETKFVADLPEEDKQLWGYSEDAPGTDGRQQARLAQTTPDGRYLLFDSFAELITAGPEADTSDAQQVYRYDFQTGRLIRVSLGHEGFANNGNVPGFNAVIGPADDVEAASPTVNGTGRSISDDGETIVFTSAAQLQSDDIPGGSNRECASELDNDGAGCQVYLWRNGAVTLISDGRDPGGAVYAGMSASGSDIFFQTRTQLVGQDTDGLGDIYDARIDGGFSAPTAESSCSGEACQGTASSAPTFGVPASQLLTGDGNLTPPSNSFAPPKDSKPKPLTTAQKLAKALKRCKADKRKKRLACQHEAEKIYRATKQSQRK